MANYFGFAIADSMFPLECQIAKSAIDPATEKSEIEAATNCCNSSHAATITAAENKFKLKLEIPEKPPSISLSNGDSIIIMGVRGLPRLTDNRHYSGEEIAAATFTFSKYTVEEKQ